MLVHVHRFVPFKYKYNVTNIHDLYTLFTVVHVQLGYMFLQVGVFTMNLFEINKKNK